MSEENRDSVGILTRCVRDALRHDMVNGYTALSPRRTADGTQSFKVKDARSSKTLTITISEDKE